MTSPQLETLNYLQAALANGQTYAVVTQAASGALSISIEVGPGPGELEIEPLRGPQGPAGTAQFPLRLQLEVLADPSLLPTDLTNTNADIGRYWLIDTANADGAPISSAAYIWFGTRFRYLKFGTMGPPGKYGVIAPYVSLIGDDQTSELTVTGSGTSTDPYLATFELSIPEGPPGPSAALATFADVAETTPPTVGQYMTCTGETVVYEGHTLPLWAPSNTDDAIPQPYVVPQASFTSYAGITFASTVTICTFSVPANAFDWKPVVFGQIQMFELEASFNPLSVGIEVRLGSPTGTLVARGFGNSMGGVVTILPHASSASSPDRAITPWNSVGLVQANHGGAEGTLYVNLVNDGIAAIYDYNPAGAQLFVLAVPATTQAALGQIVYGSLTTKVKLLGQPVLKERVFMRGEGTLTAGVESWPITQEFTTSGTYTPPSWWISGTHFLDLIAVGDGGGGSTANDFGAGGPGGAGAWATTTITTLSSGHLTITIGEGGRGSTTTANGSHGSGVTIADGGTNKLTAAGGTGGIYADGGPLNGTGWYGPSPGTKTYEGQTFSPTNGAGEGGSGTNHIFTAGSRGQPGAVWIVARKT